MGRGEAPYCCAETADTLVGCLGGVGTKQLQIPIVRIFVSYVSEVAVRHVYMDGVPSVVHLSSDCTADYDKCTADLIRLRI